MKMEHQVTLRTVYGLYHVTIQGHKVLYPGGNLSQSELDDVVNREYVKLILSGYTHPTGIYTMFHVRVESFIDNVSYSAHGYYIAKSNQNFMHL